MIQKDYLCERTKMTAIVWSYFSSRKLAGIKFLQLICTYLRQRIRLCSISYHNIGLLKWRSKSKNQNYDTKILVCKR